MKKTSKKDEWAEKMEKKHDNHAVLLANIKAYLPGLKTLMATHNGHWSYEDMIYRYYHHSFKVYCLQDCTEDFLKVLRAIRPKGVYQFNSQFNDIIAEGIGKKFDLSHNQAWSYHTRPILEAYFHAKFFLEMAIKYGEELDEAPEMLPSGWAALLYLYGLR